MFIPDTPVNKNDEENERKVRHKLYAAILERYAIISTLYIFMAWWPAYHLICSMLFDKFSNIHFLQDKC
jgi:hypothetical protein